MVARFDLATDPAVRSDLLDARRATAFFARKLNELGDAELDAPTLLPDWSRRHLVAHLGYNARGLCRLVAWGNTGIETPMYASAEQRDREIERGATLLPHALRHLFDHAAVSLNVEWRDTDDSGWDATVRTAQGRLVPLTETIWMRTRELWIHAVDLDNGARWSDVPEHVTLRLLADITGAWAARSQSPVFELRTPGGAVVAGGRGPDADAEAPAEAVTIEGELADLLAWAAGRARAAEEERLTARSGGLEIAPPRPPRWI